MSFLLRKSKACETLLFVKFHRLFSYQSWVFPSLLIKLFIVVFGGCFSAFTADFLIELFIMVFGSCFSAFLPDLLIKFFIMLFSSCLSAFTSSFFHTHVFVFVSH